MPNMRAAAVLGVGRSAAQSWALAAGIRRELGRPGLAELWREKLWAARAALIEAEPPRLMEFEEESQRRLSNAQAIIAGSTAKR
jgi:hypothetical protein